MLVGIGGPAGSGKTLLIRRLLEDFSNTTYLPSYTTRPKREDEQPGNELTFVSEQEFMAMRAKDLFAWTRQPHKSLYWYGTLHTDIARAMDDEEHIYFGPLVIDVFAQLRAENRGDSFARLCLIYLYTDDHELLRKRMQGKRTDIDERLASMPKENALARQLERRLPIHLIDATLFPEEVEMRAVHIINTYMPL